MGVEQVSMPNPIQDKTILLGVTGSIAAYKAADLASKLMQAGAKVDVVLTQPATQFITPLTFQSVTARKAYVDADLWGGEGHVTHIGLGRAADLVVIAPASANTLAKLAHGIGDNLLTVAVLAAQCPLMLAPAMDAGMFSHPATQANLEVLRQRGAVIIGPAAGRLASGLVGMGRMVEPAEILGAIRWQLSKGGSLAKLRVVVTAGGTQEPVDPVRVLTNRSSGKQGYAVAQAALDAGAEVVLISTPVQLLTPFGARRVEVQTAAEMLDAVLAEVANADALVMAAAVADFRPALIAGQKIKKENGLNKIRLERTADVLQAVAEARKSSAYPRVVIGCAAETQDLLVNARKKLQTKQLDLIVANDVTATDAGFAVDTNRVTLLAPGLEPETLPNMPKSEVAEVIVARLIGMLK
jgi:phosphopantothenoylcysteine decarboxylase/phosphopantothenate--cysteine ligase